VVGCLRHGLLVRLSRGAASCDSSAPVRKRAASYGGTEAGGERHPGDPGKFGWHHISDGPPGSRSRGEFPPSFWGF
jgi:hypothetical protein